MNRSGFVIANNQLKKVRYRTMNSLGQIVWTTDIDKALHFARREDADTFAKEDEDAWSIQEHFFNLSLKTLKASQIIKRLQELIENFQDQDVNIALHNPDNSYGPVGVITSIIPDADATTFYIDYKE